MDTILRRYLWVVDLAAVGGCALFLGHAAARALDVVDEAPGRPRLVRATRPPQPRAAIDRNIFCSSCREAGPAPAEPAAPQRSDLPVALVATMCAPPPGTCTLAVIRGLDDRSLRAFGRGGLMRDAAISEIRPTRVYLDRGGRREYLDLLPGVAADPIEPFEPARPTPAVAAAQDIRQLGPDSYEVPRATLDRLLGNLNLVAESTRIVPEVHDGLAAGFRLYRVEHDGPLGRLGLQNGDLIQEVNGLSLAGADSALDAFVKLRSASHISIGIERNGRRLTKEVRIR
jgi:general secretion pathway protein C